MTDGRSLNLSQIQLLIRTMVVERGIKQVFIDYDQKIFVDDPRDEWRTLQVAAESLEQIAITNNIHITLLSQADENGDPKVDE